MNKACALVLLLAGMWQLGTWGAALIGWALKRLRRRGRWHVTLTIRGSCTHDFYLAERLSVAHVVLSKCRVARA